MNELTDATDGGAEESAQVEATSEATAEQDTGTEETGQADDAGEETEDTPKRVPWFQKRIDEVTRQKYDAQREAEYWRGLAEGRVQNQMPAKEVGPPQLEQFNDYDQYEQARIEYLASQIVDQRLQQAQHEQQRQQVIRSYSEREANARKAHPDFDTVVRDPSLPITPTMAQVIHQTDSGPEVAYYLGSNREEAERIAALPDYMQAAALGRIEAALTKAQTPPAQTKTPPAPPPKTVGGLSSGISKDPADMSMAEYVEWMKSRG